jgi:hypothetical protein
MGLDDPYLAYCLDQAVLWLTSEVADKHGKQNWNKVHWKDSEQKTNRDFISFVQRQK